MTGVQGERGLRWMRLGTVPYREAWVLQNRLAEARRRGEIDDVLLTLEHPPVFTMGRNGEARHLRAGPASLRDAGAEYIEVDRGGSVTFHGPGQLVAYPIIALEECFPMAGQAGRGDVLRYLRALEDALIATAADHGVTVHRRPPYTGVWSGKLKLAAIGVKLSRGVTTHGIALNVGTDLRWFDLVVPCGIEGAGVASLESLGGATSRPAEVAAVLAAHLARVFGERLFEADPGLAALTGDRPGAAAAA